MYKLTDSLTLCCSKTVYLQYACAGKSVPADTAGDQLMILNPCYMQFSAQKSNAVPTLVCSSQCESEHSNSFIEKTIPEHPFPEIMKGLVSLSYTLFCTCVHCCTTKKSYLILGMNRFQCQGQQEITWHLPEFGDVLPITYKFSARKRKILTKGNISSSVPGRKRLELCLHFVWPTDTH